MPKAKEQSVETDVPLWARPLAWGLRMLVARPRDSVLTLVCAFAIGGIVINSLYLQPGPHPAPIFVLKSTPVLEEEPVILPRRRPAEAPQAELKATGAPVKAASAPARQVTAPRQDPIADLLAGSHQLTAVQRALSEFGYGPVTPNGVYGPETRAAIERFERERKLPVTGQVSDRLVRELAQLVGKPI